MQFELLIAEFAWSCRGSFCCALCSGHFGFTNFLCTFLLACLMAGMMASARVPVPSQASSLAWGHHWIVPVTTLAPPQVHPAGAPAGFSDL